MPTNIVSVFGVRKKKPSHDVETYRKFKLFYRFIEYPFHMIGVNNFTVTVNLHSTLNSNANVNKHFE